MSIVLNIQPNSNLIKGIEDGIPNAEELNSLVNLCIENKAETDKNINKIKLGTDKSFESFHDEIKEKSQDMPLIFPDHLSNEKINSENNSRLIFNSETLIFLGINHFMNFSFLPFMQAYRQILKNLI